MDLVIYCLIYLFCNLCKTFYSYFDLNSYGNKKFDRKEMSVLHEEL